MKRKGFTLVELLAVIAILAILVIIALPNVLKMFNDSKKNAFIVQARKTANVAQEKLITGSKDQFDCNELLTGQRFGDCTATTSNNKVSVDVLDSGTYENFLMIDVTSDANSGTFVDLSKLKVMDTEKSFKEDLIKDGKINSKFEILDGDNFVSLYKKLGISGDFSNVIESYNESVNSIIIKDNKVTTTTSGGESLLLISYKVNKAGVYQYTSSNEMSVIVLDSSIKECESTTNNADELSNCTEQKTIPVYSNDSAKSFEVKDNDIIYMIFPFNTSYPINNFSLGSVPFIVNGESNITLLFEDAANYKDGGISYKGKKLSSNNNEVFEYGKVGSKEGTYKYNYIVRTKDGYDKYIREITVVNPTNEKCFKFNSETQKIERYYYYEDNKSSGKICPKDVAIPKKINNVQVKSIGTFAFMYSCEDVVAPDSCEKSAEITSVVLPEGLKEIDEYAFSENKLKKITIPKSVTLIGQSAFENNNLKNVTFNGNKNDITILCGAFYGRNHVYDVNNIVKKCDK